MAQIKQSIAWWCYQEGKMTLEQLVRVAAEIGYRGIELVEQHYWRHIKDAGLEIVTLKGQASIERGFNRREHHANLEREVLASIILAAQWGIPNVIVFSGNRDGLDDKTGAEITAQGLKRVAGVAHNEGVTLLLELLNSRVDHPDYQADKTAWGIEVCQLVDSPAVRLLYDIYHMQIMEGDIIRTVQQHHAYFSHYHTAGNPGRHELNETQELQYGAIVQAIAAIGYDGYIGQEFIPIGEPEAALRQAFSVCNAGMLRGKKA
ncbi:MAG: TIM barrel protein [Ktedonobacteraceae bacterium]